MPVPGGSGPYQPGKFYIPATSVDAAATPAVGLDTDSIALAELAATLTAEIIAVDAATATELATGMISSTAADTASVGEGTALVAALVVGDAALLTEAAVATLTTVSQDVTDIEPLVLAEIETLLAEVGAADAASLGELVTDPVPIAPPVGRPEIDLFHVAGMIHPLPDVVAPEDEETVLALSASAWLAWYD